MIQPVLPPACYTDQAWFDREQKKIFGKVWLLAGLTQQLQEENSFITRNFSGVPVVVQNVGGGQLRAFRNACAHRAMPVQVEPCGNRKLICPYHGWAYRADGKLRGIPNEKLYGLGKDEQSTLGLEPYALETVGNFVFVNLSENPPPLADQYPDEHLRILRGLSTCFDTHVSYSVFTGHYNWKLNYENILDWNHVQFVHKQTLAPMLEFDSATGAQKMAQMPQGALFEPGGALADIPFTATVLPPADKPVDIRFLGRSGRITTAYQPRWYTGLIDSLDPGAFINVILPPNANFGSVHGENYYLQQYVPVAPDRTEYHSWVFTSRRKPGVPVLPHLLWYLHHGEKRVVDEDKVLLEALQKSLAKAPGVGLFGEHEANLKAFGNWYEQIMENGQ